MPIGFRRRQQDGKDPSSTVSLPQWDFGNLDVVNIHDSATFSWVRSFLGLIMAQTRGRKVFVQPKDKMPWDHHPTSLLLSAPQDSCCPVSISSAAASELNSCFCLLLQLNETQVTTDVFNQLDLYLFRCHLHLFPGCTPSITAQNIPIKSALWNAD